MENVGSLRRGQLHHTFVPSVPDYSSPCAVAGCGVGREYHQGPHHDAYLAWQEVRDQGGSYDDAQAAWNTAYDAATA